MFKKYSSIEQFRNTVHYVSKYFTTPPIITFKGTVKLHGTNACIIVSKEGVVQFQSRNNIITPGKDTDNAGFAGYMDPFKAELKNAFHNPDEDVYVYGEWCGENIQKDVGIAQLTKRFIVFDEKYEEKCIHLKSAIYNIHGFKTWNIEIDFTNPEACVEELTRITTEVENQCPVAKAFGVEGIGEGVVWTPYDIKTDIGYLRFFKPNEMMFKVKGEKHSTSKVKTLIPLTAEQIAQNLKITEFIEYVVTPNRVSQAIAEFKAESSKDTGKVIKWVMQDIFKEEADVMEAAGLSSKDVGKAAPKAIKTLYFNSL